MVAELLGAEVQPSKELLIITFFDHGDQVVIIAEVAVSGNTSPCQDVASNVANFVLGKITCHHLVDAATDVSAVVLRVLHL